MNNKYFGILLVLTITGAFALITINSHKAPIPVAHNNSNLEPSTDSVALRPPLERNALQPPLSHPQPLTSPNLSPKDLASKNITSHESSASKQVQGLTDPQNASDKSKVAEISSAKASNNVPQDKVEVENKKSSQVSKDDVAKIQEKRITGIRITSSGTMTKVRIMATEAIKFKQHRMGAPERLILDLDGNWQIRAPGVPANTLLSNVRIGKRAKQTRIVLDLKAKPASTAVIKTSNGLEVRLQQ